MQSPTPLALTRDINGYVSYGLAPSAQGENVVLAANTLVTLTVPSGPALKYLAIITYSPGAVVWVQFDSDTVLTLPTGTPASGTKELLPSAREVIPGQDIQLIARAANSEVGIKYYAIQRG